MQKASRSDQRDRLFFYGARLVNRQVEEGDTSEPFGDQISFYLLELPRIMHYTDEYDSPVAGWCRIFRNFAVFAKSLLAIGMPAEQIAQVAGLSLERIKSLI